MPDRLDEARRRDGALLDPAEIERNVERDFKGTEFGRWYPGTQRDYAQLSEAERQALQQRWMQEEQRRRNAAQERVDAPPTPHVRTEENVSNRSRCQGLVICFMPGPGVNAAEFQKQRAEQNAGLNAMSPATYRANRSAYLANPAGQRALSKGADPRTSDASRLAAARSNYRSANLRRYQARYGAQGPARLDRDMTGLAAPHAPDMTAGGAPSAVTRLGPRSVNSSIGGQWGANNNPNSRANRLQRHAAQQAANRCPTIAAQLAVCPSRPRSGGVPLQ